MFSGFAVSVWRVSIGDLSTWDTGKVTDMSSMFSGFAANTDSAVDIGSFCIPKKASITSFANGATTLSAEIGISSSVSSGTNAFLNAATKQSGGAYISEIILVPMGTDGDTAANTVITLWGLSGTSSKGNIYLMELATVLYSDGVLVINQPTTEIAERTATGVSVRTQYEPLSSSTTYVFDAYSKVLWYANRSYIESVKFGSINKTTA
jgi:hypothetical protein